jgi:hypothetical protein
VLDFQGWVKTTAKYEILSQEESTDDQGRATFVHLLRRKA